MVVHIIRHLRTNYMCQHGDILLTECVSRKLCSELPVISGLEARGYLPATGRDFVEAECPCR